MNRVIQLTAPFVMALVATGTTNVVGMTVTIGDNDGFGFGSAAVPDGADLLNLNLSEDRRSAAETAATNGAEQTDFYSALLDPLKPTFDAVFPLGGQHITSGVLTIDMGGFQAKFFGPITVAFNGTPQPALDFTDSLDGKATAVRTFNLPAATIDAANLADELRVTFSRPSTTSDAIAFDYFQLDAQVAAPIPEAASVIWWSLVGLTLTASRWRRKRRS